VAGGEKTGGGGGSKLKGRMSSGRKGRRGRLKVLWFEREREGGG